MHNNVYVKGNNQHFSCLSPIPLRLCHLPEHTL